MKVLEKKLPLSLSERLEMEDELRVSSSVEEFFEFALNAQHKVQYHDGEIISLDMGIDSKFHELIVANIIRLLGNFFLHSAKSVYGSNRLVYVPECRDGYNPDVLLVEGEDELIKYKKNKKTLEGVLNPAIVVEVLSKGTRDFDLGVKLPCYKKIASMQQIIIIEQEKVLVSVYQRTDKANEWLNIDYDDLFHNLRLNEAEIPLKEIYRGVFVEKIKK